MTVEGPPDGRQDGPLHVRGEVLAAKTAGAFRHLTLVAPGIGERSRPGSFLAVSVGEASLARRALWIHRVRTVGGHRAAIDVVVEPRGTGTRWLAALSSGMSLEITGPLGRPFSLPREAARCLLVGEGYAAAPLLALSERLRERGCGSVAATRATCSTCSRRVVRSAGSRSSPATRPPPSWRHCPTPT